MFSAGADVALFAGMSAAQLRPLIGSFIDLGHRIERLPFPTLAAVHGTCMAGGVERVAARAGLGRARVVGLGEG